MNAVPNASVTVDIIRFETMNNVDAYCCWVGFVNIVVAQQLKIRRFGAKSKG